MRSTTQWQAGLSGWSANLSFFVPFSWLSDPIALASTKLDRDAQTQDDPHHRLPDRGVVMEMV
jgi:hypothetical protein